MAEDNPTFRFVNYHKIAGVGRADANWESTWLRADDFSESEKKQLANILEEWDLDGDPFTGSCKDFQDLAECGFDLWDVVDATEQLVFSIWTYTDSGMIYRYGTTKRVGEIIQWGAEFDDNSVGWDLEDARLAQKTLDPSVPLPSSLKPT